MELPWGNLGVAFAYSNPVGEDAIHLGHVELARDFDQALGSVEIAAARSPMSAKEEIARRRRSEGAGPAIGNAAHRSDRRVGRAIGEDRQFGRQTQLRRDTATVPGCSGAIDRQCLRGGVEQTQGCEEIARGAPIAIKAPLEKARLSACKASA